MWLARVGLLASTATTLALTLSPAASPELAPSAQLLGKTADGLSNFALFLPFGAFAGPLGWSFARTVGLALALSLFVEAAQLVVPGRVTSGLDIIMNTMGAAAGHAAWRRFLPYWLSSPGRARTVAYAGAIVAVSLSPVAGWLQQPLARRAAYYVHRPPDVGHLAPWSGQIHAVKLDEAEIPNGRVEELETFRRALAGDHRVVIDATWNEFPERLGSPLLVTAEGNDEIWVLGAEQRDLVHRYATRAQLVGLQGGYARWPNALHGTDPTRSVRMSAVRRRGDLCLAVDQRQQCGFAPGPGDHWRLLIPEGPTAARFHSLLSSLSTFLVVAPLGFAGGLAGAPAVLATALSAAAALWVAPAITGLRPPGPGLALLAGVVLIVAAMLGRRVAVQRGWAARGAGPPGAG